MSAHYYVVNPKGKPIQARDYDHYLDWTRDLANNGLRYVAQAEFGDYHVHTLFVGMDDRLFETTITGGPHDGQTVPASTWAQAQKNHVRVCELLAAEAVRELAPDSPSPFV